MRIKSAVCNRAILAACGLAGVLLAGCLDDADELSTEPDEIVVGANTITDTDVNPRWSAVVRVCGGGTCCSGTLVSPVHVLSAGHCRAPVGAVVNLDTPAGGGSGTGRRQYTVIRNQTLSTAVASGRDLALLLLDAAVPTFGTSGSPEYSVRPAPAFAPVSNSSLTWTVGYGFGDDCVKTGGGVRRGLPYRGGFQQYAYFPGVLTRRNLPCDDVNKGPSPGDSGGPLLDPWGQVVGVFSGWACRDAAGNLGGSCAGTIEWSGLSNANALWLVLAKAGDFDGDGIADLDDPRPGLNCNGSSPPAACAGVLPDFEITKIAAAGCTGTGGDPIVAVTVRNNGPVAADAMVELFLGLQAAPTVGMFSWIRRSSKILAMRETQTLWFAIPPGLMPPTNPTWADAIVDTERLRLELVETNNVHSRFITLPDCSFN